MQGFQLHLYFNQCVDKDECGGPTNPCGNNQCINTVGSFTCGCPRNTIKHVGSSLQNFTLFKLCHANQTGSLEVFMA